MTAYDPCVYCAKLSDGGLPDMFGEERCAGCRYFESVKENNRRIERTFEKLDFWEDIYRNANQPVLCSVVRTLSLAIKSILLKQ